LDQIGIF